MPKLRKMLGNVTDPVVQSRMGLIETQSRSTLAHWAVNCAAQRYLPIYESAYPEDSRLRNALSAVQDLLLGSRKLADIQPLLRAAAGPGREAGGNPAAQAAARAAATACSTVQTPSSALGFTFYGAAAAAYHTAGLSADAGAYDSLAAKELEALLKSLQEIAVPNEPNPAKISWNC